MKSLVTSGLFILVSCSWGFAQESFKYEKQIDALVQPYLENDKFTGVSVGVVLDGKAWTLGYGQLSEMNAAKPDADTIYEIGSISKVFTSLLLADAVTQGKVRLDQPIGELMDGLVASNPSVGNNITLQHLSQHMSGLPRMPSNFKPAVPTNPFSDYDFEMLTEFMKSVKPARKPGEKSEYSNLAAGMLGDILADQADVSYETLLTARVLKPLGMTDTSLELSDDQRKRLAPPHNSSLSPDHNWDFGALAGAGAIRSSVNDMNRFIEANLKRPEGELGTALALAWKEQLSAGDGRQAMGLGWMVAADGSTRWHNGQTGGYHSMVLVNRKQNAGVVILSNTAGREPDELAQTIYRLIIGMEVASKKFAPEFKVDAAVVERLVGKYQLAPQVVLAVTANGNRMMVQLTGQQVLGVTAESETVWNLNDVKAQLRFDLPESGPASQVTLHQNGMIMPAPRIK